MLIRFGFEIDVESAVRVPMLLALSIHPSVKGRIIGRDDVRVPESCGKRTYLDRFDNRITRIISAPGHMKMWSDCVIELYDPFDAVNPFARQHAIDELPDDVLTYLVASRYVDSDNLISEAWRLFAQYEEGWPRVQAITAFAHDHIEFGYNFGRANKTSSDVYSERNGVCRDFAHLAIALCRAMNIPARYASGYLGDIGVPYSGPGDFCAWFEVYLENKWYTFDARYNTPRAGRILMVRGADAADVAMITSFGAYDLKYFRIWTEEVDNNLADPEIHSLLSRLPDTEPLVYPSALRVSPSQSESAN